MANGIAAFFQKTQTTEGTKPKTRPSFSSFARDIIF